VTQTQKPPANPGRFILRPGIDGIETRALARVQIETDDAQMIAEDRPVRGDPATRADIHDRKGLFLECPSFDESCRHSWRVVDVKTRHGAKLAVRPVR
jgi:hypothetical protein